MDTLIVLPTYNESENVSALIKDIFMRHPKLDILVVDDSSPDKTYDIIQKLQKEFPRLFLKIRKTKSGLGSAYKEGFDWGMKRNYDYFIGMDSDYSHHPKHIASMLELAPKYHLIIGSRYTNGYQMFDTTWMRFFLTLFSNLLIKLVLPSHIKDMTSGFKLMSREALKNIQYTQLMSKGYSIQIEIIYKILNYGLKVKEIPIVFKNRVEGESKMNFGILLESLIILVKLRLMTLTSRKKTHIIKRNNLG